MAKKSFFAERTAAQIEDLSVQEVMRQRGLVKTIDDLNPAIDALVVRAQLIPGRFFRGVETQAQASRKAYRHGDLVALSHPQTKQDCYESREIPLMMRARDFARLGEMKEEDINFFGYSVRPEWGDRTKRVFPFVWIPEGVRLFGYAENNTGGIGVEPYADARKVRTSGASVVVSVPSRTKKNPRYKFKLVNVPFVSQTPENLASVLTLRPQVIQDDATGEPITGRTPHDNYNIRYGYEGDREGDNPITFYPHDLAGYLGIVKGQLGEHNMTAMEMNPFALPSRHQAEFYMKLCNNVLMFDPTLEGKTKLRKPHVAEKSLLLVRAIGVFGHDDFAFWEPARDGKLKDYNWEIPGKD
ncbi:hypothetical protein J4233_01455 [Candidatus Pacearchaeota archaeon]|nr:hypothetical protein [Candidatus Pacearchaeota archaeon]